MQIKYIFRFFLAFFYPTITKHLTFNLENISNTNNKKNNKLKKTFAL